MYDMIPYALEMRYVSVQAFKLLCKQMTLPSLPYLMNFTRGKFIFYTYVSATDNPTRDSLLGRHRLLGRIQS